MKNRAKCKLCNHVIESFHATDYVMCKCGHIAVDGGDAMKCYAKDWSNFVRVDDNNNEVIVKINNDKEIDVKPLDIDPVKPTRKELIEMLNEMIKNIENLPPQAMSTPITHYDLLSALLLLSEIAKSAD